MFSEAQKTAYQSVKAPEALRERVLNMAKEAPAVQQRKRPAQRWMGTAVAACLVLVASIAMLLPRDDVTLQMGGMTVTETATPVAVNAPMTARALSSMSLPVTVETKTAAELRVSHGLLLAEDGTEVNAVAGGTTALYWTIQDVDPDTEYTLRVSGDEITLLTLAFDDAANCWTVSAAKE